MTNANDRCATSGRSQAIQPISTMCWRQKYLKAPSSRIATTCSRGSRARWPRSRPKASARQWQARFLGNLRAGAIGAGRIMSAAGTGTRGHADQLLRPAGGRLHPGRGRRAATPASTKPCAKRPRPCAAAAASATTSRASGRAAPRCRPRPRMASGPVQLHRRLRPLVLDRRERGRAPRRADGRAAHRPSGRAGVHHRQAHAGALEQLQRLGRR